PRSSPARPPLSRNSWPISRSRVKTRRPRPRPLLSPAAPDSFAMETSGISRRLKKGASAPRTHVLVVDDSAVVRQSMTLVLGREKDLRVTTPADPIIAMEKMRRDRPDVVILDLEMPRMDGLTFLRNVMKTDPLPIVVCSGIAERGSAKAIEAIEEGAVDVLSK